MEYPRGEHAQSLKFQNSPLKEWKGLAQEDLWEMGRDSHLRVAKFNIKVLSTDPCLLKADVISKQVLTPNRNVSLSKDTRLVHRLVHPSERKKISDSLKIPHHQHRVC